MAFEHWRYYLAVEEDVLQTGRYVEIAKSNALTHSIEYTRLLLAIGSEIDVVCKLLSRAIDPTIDLTTRRDINNHHDVIVPRYPKIKDFEIHPVQWGFTWTPWHGWENGKPPTWWSDHNKVKHQRYEHFALANQDNVLAALCGLCVVNLFYYKANGELWNLPPSKLIPYLFPMKIPSSFKESDFEGQPTAAPSP